MNSDHRHASLDAITPQHGFAGAGDAAGERRTVRVVILTAVMMVAEIAAGWITGSMALLADGWHMGSHVAALGLSAFAYRFARRHAQDRRFSFGTGKVGPLAGFASALALGFVALVMAWESADRLIAPVAIDYDVAMLVAAIGLVVNLASALLLGDGHHHDGHDHHHDHNLRAAYVHVLADALTSVLALAALAGGRLLGIGWLDPVVGIVGAGVILYWAAGLVRSSAKVLLDEEASQPIADDIRARIEADADNRVADFHLWQVGTGHLALILSIATHRPRHPDHYKQLLSGMPLAHVTVEVIPCPCPDAPPAS